MRMAASSQAMWKIDVTFILDPAAAFAQPQMVIVATLQF